MPKSIVILLIIVLSGGLFLGLGKQISTALQAGQRLEKQALEVNKLQEDNFKLKKQLAEVQTYGFWEKQARDKLNLTKPGETVVIIPHDSVEKVLGVYNTQIERIEIPNWEKWIKLFF